MSCSSADVGPDAARLGEQTATEPAPVKKGETKRGGNIQAHHHHHQHPTLQGEYSLLLHCKTAKPIFRTVMHYITASFLFISLFYATKFKDNLLTGLLYLRSQLCLMEHGFKLCVLSFTVIWAMLHTWTPSIYLLFKPLSDLFLSGNKLFI